ncbi:MAG TPA: 2-isopropylmalate synthase [Candidatus Methanoperedenaceae archaeon]|nr:2-isopropylmalate synthase [Candidatus Methanoperedenaceae archaeon]
MRNKHITVFDTTLRDGEQTPGVSLIPEQKLSVAAQLSKLGVDIIEAGFPSSSEGEKKAVRDIAQSGLDSDVCGLARVVIADIDACLDCDVDMVHTFIPTSEIQRTYTIKKSKEEVLQMAVNAVSHIKDHGVKCMFSAMDATRTDIEFLRNINKAVEDAGCDVVNVPDTVGVFVPSAMVRLISDISEVLTIPIDVHCHNDFGLAVANTLAAVEGGARQVQVTINGLGERAGNADLSETVMSLHSIYGPKTNIRTKYILETSKLVERFTGVKMPPTMPIVGDNAFAHESGIHTHGVLTKTETFEPGIMTPEMVGHRRRIVIGKHAGRHAVKQALEHAGYAVNDEQLGEIMRRVKDIGDKGKRVTDADLFAITDALLGQVSKKELAFDLKEVSVMTGNIITPTAAVKACFRGSERIAAQTGVGPVDAAMKAVQSILGEESRIKLREFRIDAISGGSDALAEVSVGVEDEQGRMVSAKAAREDIAMASVEALVTAINRLLAMK